MLIDGCHRQLLLSVLLQNPEKIQVNLLLFHFFHNQNLLFDLRSGDYGLTRGGSNSNYPYNGADNSPTSYDNKIHVSEIYGNSKFYLFLSLININNFF